MFIKVNANQGFNSDQVGWWKYEIPELPPPPPPPPPTRASRSHGREDAEEERSERSEPEVAPAALEPLPPDAIMTLYMTTGGECVFIGADADKVRNYYSVPSSYLTVL
jgi:hypothetical protein